MIALFAAAAIALAASGEQHHSTKPPAIANDDASTKTIAARLSITPAQLVALARLSMQAGMSYEDMVSGVHGLGKSATDAKFGRNNDAAALLMGWRVQTPELSGGGALDTGRLLAAVARHIAAIKNPYSQEAACETLGCLQLLPLLRLDPDEVEAALGLPKGLQK